MNSKLLFQVIKNRRSIRKYKPKKVKIEKIEKLIEAARWAPSAGNSQPWKFAIIANKKTINALKMITPGWLGVDDPPIIIVVCLDTKRATPYSHIDVGAAMQNILLYAHSSGLGCCAIASFEIDSTINLLGLPEDIKPVLFITIGYPDQEPINPSRLSLSELIVKRLE